MARIILGSYMVQYPLGGNLSWALQWLVGLSDRGDDVCFVEKAAYPNACFDPTRQVMSDDCSHGISVLRQLLQPWQLHNKFCFVDALGSYHGMDRKSIEDAFSRADLFIDMGTHGAWLAEAATAGLRVLVELEPAYTQIKMQAAKDKGHFAPAYDAYYTNGLNIGKSASSAPVAGVAWRHVMNPVIPRLFSAGAPPANASFTTVMNWQSHETVEFNGIQYGQKDVEFEKFESLPFLVDVPMEIAVAGRGVPRERLTSRGWRLRDAHNVTRSVESYLNYIHYSRGEFAVCKNVFVATNSGWFSDRSAAYLASGRPVVVQATGFESHLPCGEGLFAVRSPAEAAEAIESVVADYPRHSRAARKIALEYLDAKVVLGRFLSELGI